jgi:hypothetical protein
MGHVIERGVAKNVMLSLVTNGTIANDEIYDLASRFKSVMIGVSIDGVGAINDYIREGSAWTDIEPNIRRFKQIPNCSVYINLTYQAYNMLHVTDVAAFAVNAGIHFRYEFLQGPAHLSCTAMPKSARDEAVAKIRRFVGGAPPSDETKRAHRDAVCDTLVRLAGVIEANDVPHDPKVLEDFMTFTNDLDISREQNFASVNAELLELIETSGTSWSKNTRYAKFATRKKLLPVRGFRKIDPNIIGN